ncbi:FecR family protein [Vitreimonas flagellata]|uniref:FecR family protein n=1 Tax=Vitreimonas flagellata TaxID=2560861 RepID=UPI001074EA80|nr:FecR domain-containing protein [Vitreimonas flagellata]
MTQDHSHRMDRQDRRIAAEASDWLTRQSGANDAQAIEDFERWIEADPRHLEAYERLARTWDDLGALQHLRPLVSAHTPFASPVRALRIVATALARPSVMVGGAVFAAIAFLAFYFAPGAPRLEPQFATAFAEIEPIELSDGTRVTLGARSGFDVAYTQTDREVVLRSGQAFFEVAHNTARPFIVHAGDVAVRVVGTKFEVSRSQTQTIISVQEGVVVTALSGRSQTLHAGDRLVIDHTGQRFLSPPAMLPVASIQPAHVAAWRQGRLAYDDTPLREVVADLNRYYAPGIELADRATGDIRITASFGSDDVDGFLGDLSSAFPVHVSEDARGRYYLAGRL